MSDYLDQIVQFIGGHEFEDLPPAGVERAKMVLADSLAVTAAGSREAEVRALVEQVITPQDPQLATLLGSGLRTEPAKAGLINGTAGTFLELDEGNQFARGHPAIHVVPAALATAEAHHLSGRRFLNALVLGYEIGARIGIACKIRMSMHPHGSWGTIGAAVAVGKLLDCNARQMRELINVSSSLTLATSRRTMLEGGLVRNAYAGISGYMGILAHQLVAAGFNGEQDGLQTVFGSVVSESFDPREMTADLSTRYEILRNYFKAHACCRYNHATLDALTQIMAKVPPGRLTPATVARVEVQTYSLAAQLCDPEPRNTLAGKFSIPFAVATTLIHGHTGVDCFRPKAIEDPAIRELARKVNVVADPQLTAMMPAQRPARVAVTLTDGTQLQAKALINKGDFEDPYSPEELAAKFQSLAIPVWGNERASKLYAGIQCLDKLADINALTEAIKKFNQQATP